MRTPVRELTAWRIWPAMAPVESSPATVTRTWIWPTGAVSLDGETSQCLLGSGFAEAIRFVSWGWVRRLSPSALKSSEETPRAFWTSGDQTAMVVLAVGLGLCGAAVGVVCAGVGAAASTVAITRMAEMLPIDLFTDPPIPLFESYCKKRRLGT